MKQMTIYAQPAAAIKHFKGVKMYGEIRRKRAIGIDFDDTITKHPEVFKKIIQLFLEDGCEVYIVTARQENGWCEQLREFAPLVTNVIFTSAIAKQDVVEIDIWIDDFPLGITHDFTEAKWKASDKTKENYL